MGATLLWFRLDLRLEDNPALLAAVARRQAVVPFFIWAPEEEKPWAPGAASKWWLHQSLHSLGQDLKKKGCPLLLRRGPSEAEIFSLLRETGADAVYFNRRYEPALWRRDQKIQAALEKKNIEVKTFNAHLLYDPWELKTRKGEPFRVFTPFWNTLVGWPKPPLPERLSRSPKGFPQELPSVPLQNLSLEPKVDWAGGIRETWRPGEAGARQALQRFISEALADYQKGRDRPDRRGTSRLSPHLHFGEISPRRIWHEIQKVMPHQLDSSQFQNGMSYLRQIAWRDFAHHLLFHFPKTPLRPLRQEFEKFPWRKNHKRLLDWQRGRTGYPLVDAGMRELWHTGWMHNRVRLVTASFLVKDLLVPWQEGAKWFWDTLVDADLADNTLGWQWTAGCGADAAPFFRVFNPIIQGEKFDPEGDYLRQWVPELSGLPNKWIHRPWEAPQEILKRAGIRLGKDYPRPVTSHDAARREALTLFKKMRKK